MTITALKDLEERLPTPEEINGAAEAMIAIEKYRDADGKLAIGDATLSASLADMMSDLFSIIARGETVTLVPLSRQLTTQEAADLLNVSRPYLIKLIKEGAIECELVGTHRRLALSDVLAYKDERSQKRASALQELYELSEGF